MKVAVLTAAKFFEVAAADGLARRTSFENSGEGVRQFQQWVLEGYRRGSDISAGLWDGEAGLHDSVLVERVREGKILFRRWLPWRSANGLISFNHVGHAAAVAYSK